MAVKDSQRKETTKPTNTPEMAQDSDYTSASQAGDLTFMQEAYEGSGGFKSGRYLIPYFSETRAVFERRKHMAHYKGYVRPIIRATIDPVFNAEIKRDILVGGTVKTDGILATEFVKDATGGGESLQQFTDRVLTKGALHGAAFGVVDNVPQDRQPASVGEAIKTRAFPYAYLRGCDEVENCERDKTGRLVWIRFKEPDITDEKGNKVELCIRYDAVNITKERKVKDAYIAYETVVHGVGEIPVVVDYFENRESCEKDKIIMVPPFYSLAKINLSIFNQSSEIRHSERTQGFSSLCVQESQSGNLSPSRNNYISVEKDVANMPTFASPPPELLRVLVEDSEKLREDLHRIAGQMGVNIHTAQVKSGDAYAWEYRAEEVVLKRTAQRAAAFETAIMRIFGKFAGEQFEYKVDYPDKYRPDSEADEIAELDKLNLMDLPPKTAKIIKKHAVMIKAKDWPEDEQAIIEAEFAEVQDDTTEPTPEDEPAEEKVPA